MKQKIRKTTAIAVVLISLALLVSCASANSAKQEEIHVQYRMCIGTNDKDTYTQMIPTDRAFAIIDGICTTYFEYGYTIVSAIGSWKDEAGIITHENSFICYIDDIDPESVYMAADEILKALNQSTIVIESNPMSIDFYGGR